jgi:integrase
MTKSSHAHGADSIRIGDMVQIRPRGKRGIYTAEFFHNGHHRRRSLKTTRLDIARQRAIKLEADLAVGEYKARPRALSLVEAKDDFIAAKRGEGLKSKTLGKYKNWLGAFVELAETHNVRFLHQCTDRLFDQFRAKRQETQGPKSMEGGLTIIKSFFKFFAGGTRDVLAVNPVRRCKIRKAPPKEQFTPTLKQVNGILEAASGQRKIQFAIAAFTGLRETEMTMLSPQSVDIAGGWIHVAKREGWNPKTEAGHRKVPLHPRLLALLADVKPSSAPYFFCSPPSVKYPQGNHHLNGRKLNDDLQAIAKSLGMLTGRKAGGLVFHSLRHFFETECVDSGVPQFVVDLWMGHAGQKLTGRLYYGHTDAKSQGLMKTIKF